MEPVRCGFCKDERVDQLGQLYHTKIKDKPIAAHHKCMQYSAGLSQFKFDHFGGFLVDEVDAELKRGGKLRCNTCRMSGASAGCPLRSCRKTYHLPCAPRHERIEIRYGKNRQKTRVLYRVFCKKEHETTYKEHLSETSEMVESSSDSESEGDAAEPALISDSEDNDDQPDTDNETNVKVPAQDRKPQKRGRGRPSGTLRKKTCGSRLPLNKLTSKRVPKKKRGWPLGRPRKRTRVRPLVVKLPALDVNKPSAHTEKPSTSKPTLRIPAGPSWSLSLVEPETVRCRSPVEHAMDDVTPALAEKRKRRDSDRSDSENGSVVEIKQEGLVTGADSGAETGREQTNVAKTEEAQQVNSDDVVEAKVAVKKMKCDSKNVDSSGSKINMQEKKTSTEKCHNNTRKNTNLMAKHHQSVAEPRVCSNVDGTEMNIPTPEASGSESNVDIGGHEGKHRDIQINRGSVILLIPSVLSIGDSEWAAIHRDLRIPVTCSVVWPQIDKPDSLQEKHLPHFMLDIVTCIRDNDWDKVQSILTNVNTEKYDYLLEYLGVSDKETEQTKDLTAQYLSKVADKLRGMIHKTAFLTSSKSKNMTLLVVPLSCTVPEHHSIISSLTSPVYEWNHNKSIIQGVTLSHRKEEELELLWRWLIGQIRTDFHSESYPRLGSICAIEKLLYEDSCSSEVVKELTNNLSDLEQRSGFSSSAPVGIIAINGVNRQCVKYKYFVRQVIQSMTEELDSGHLYFIVSLDQSDDLIRAGEILPEHLSGDAKIYSAFNPQEVNISCLIVHIDKTECTKTDTKTDGDSGEEDNISISDIETSEGSPSSSVVTRHESKDVSCSVVRTEDCETMLFHPVDDVWQREKVEMLGLKVKTPIPQSNSATVSRLTVPQDLVSIRKDGNCFFRAVSHILTGNQREHKTVRKMIYRFMIENDSAFSKLANCPNYAESVSMNKDGEWATEIEIFATATMLATDMCVYSPCGHDAVGKTIYKWLTYRPLRNVSPLEGVRQLRNASKWLTYKQVENVVSPENYRQHRKAIYLSNIDDHYIPVYRLGNS